MKIFSMVLGAILLVLALNGFTLLQDKDKKAILFVSFGTSYNDTRALTIDALQKEVAQNYKDYDVKLAFTSRQIIRKIYKRDGIRIDTPEEALKKLKSDGYGTVIVQSTHIINGVEAEYLKEEVKEFKDSFHVIKLGTPLLTHIKDYELTAEALMSQIKELKKMKPLYL